MIAQIEGLPAQIKTGIKDFKEHGNYLINYLIQSVKIAHMHISYAPHKML
jgi:hypothetical protein